MAESRIAVLGALTIGLLLAGCGSSQSDQEQQWIGRVQDIVHNKELNNQRVESLRKLDDGLRSGNPDQIAAGFSSYADFLGVLSQEFKGTDPPEQCLTVSSPLVGFAEQLSSVAQQLSSPEAVDTRAELIQGANDLNRSEKAFKAQFAQFENQTHC